jgi:hypothetical protein
MGSFTEVTSLKNADHGRFALADLGRVSFTVELFHSMPVRGSSPYNLTMLRSYFIHEVKNSLTGTDEEVDRVMKMTVRWIWRKRGCKLRN